MFRAGWPILPWTSQAACGSGQTFIHPFSRYYMSRASPSRCVICTTVIHTDLWNWWCVCLGRPGLVRAKIGTTGADTILLVWRQSIASTISKGTPLSATCRVSSGGCFSGQFRLSLSVQPSDRGPLLWTIVSGATRKPRKIENPIKLQFEKLPRLAAYVRLLPLRPDYFRASGLSSEGVSRLGLASEPPRR